MKSLKFTSIILCLGGMVPVAWGWGSYGHQQINAAAVELLDQKTPLGQCFARNQEFLTRLAITPDYEWKLVGASPKDAPLRAKKSFDDKFEHPLHFFEPDAFIKNGQVTREAIDALPAGSYRSVIGVYQDLRKDNEPYVTSIDPKKQLQNPQNPSAKEVAEHGTAPWRIAQLYRLGINELKQGNTQLALFYLGTMGHYVGDMSQPFHGTLNYDGQHFTPKADRIHSVFESLILSQAASNQGVTADHVTREFPSFAATRDGVLQCARQARTDDSEPLSEEQVVRESMRLVGDGAAYVQPLLEVFSKFRPRIPDVKPRRFQPGQPFQSYDPVPPQVLNEFLQAPLTDPSTGHTTRVLDVADRRMGDGAALLARLWNSALRQAQKENPALDSRALAGCRQEKFDLGFAIRNYPTPDYLPAAALPSESELAKTTHREMPRERVATTH